MYSRGLGPWFITGTNHQVVVDGRAPRHRGVLMGEVLRVQGDGVLIAPSELSTLRRSSQAMAWSSTPPPGVRPNSARRGACLRSHAACAELEVRFGNGAIDFARIRARRSALAQR